jgi:iron complex outermembrane recepter protein
MNSNPKLSYAIAAILGGSSYGLGVAQAATATDASDEGIAEITVTAQRRSESIQDVPITIQALNGETLKQLNVVTFDDLIRYTPNVTFSGNGPGQGNIFMRGLSSGDQGNQSSATTGSFPNVAVYLDDQSMQFPDRNNDVYLVDMERVEVLEGPQGTLFGGGAQAGAIRYITNKPKLDVTEGTVNAGYGVTAGGGDNYNYNATINLPLIPDALSVRATIFNDHRGGYIDNVPGTASFLNVPTAAALKAFPLNNPPTQSPIANNAALVADNTNPVDYTGVRVSMLIKINQDWNLLLQQNNQDMQADGYFSELPVSNDGRALAPYQTTAFSPAFNKDKYASTSWTLNGAVGDLLKIVYTGSYLDRSIDQQSDYSNYLRSGHGSYYSCTGRGAGYSYFRSAKPTTCYAPVGAWRDQTKNEHQSHEIRVSSNDDNRFRALAGAYWEEFVIKDNMNFNYLPIPQCSPANLAISAAGGPDCTAAVGPLPNSPYSNDPSLRLNTKTAFGEDDKRGYRQTAFFLSMDYDLIPKVLTVTAGTRYYHYNDFEEGSEYYSSSTVLNLPNGSVTAKNAAGFPINLKKTEHGFRSRGNITWHITPDIMAYYTYSQGFRPGGFNRTKSFADGTVSLSAQAPFTVGGGKQYDKPVGYDSDSLINQEIGVKSELLDHRLQVNASLYRMSWSNVQLSLFDPVHLGNTTFDVNGPTYVVKGVELQVVARVTDGLTVQGSSSWNSTNQTNAPCLQSNRVAANNPTPIGTCITQINGLPYSNPYGVLNTSPAFSPPLLFNVRARYDFPLAGDYKPFVMIGANHIASQRNEPASFPLDGTAFCSPVPTTTHCQYIMPGYTTYDAAIGVAKDNWSAQFTGSNITNSDASTLTSSAQFLKSEVPLRPRVLALQVAYKF